MAIKTQTFTGGGGGAGTDTLDDVTGRGATTTNAITVGGVSIGTEYSLPTADGSANQVLQSDGNGNISFQTLDFTGGLEYKGAFNATAGTPSLLNAEKGDFYIIDTAGTIYGQTWAVGDHLLINEDMGGTITNSKIDKIDNTQAVTSVNTLTGAVVLSGNDLTADHTASNYTPTNSNIDGHFSGVDTKLGTLLSDITNESLNDLSDVSYTAGSGIDNYVLTYDHSTTSWGAEAVPSAPVSSVNTQTGAVVLSGNDLTADHTASNYTPTNSNIDGHLSGIDTALGASATPTLDGVTTNGNTTTNAINVGTITTSGDILADADASRTIGAEATRFITYHGDMNGAIRFKAKNNQGSAITKGQVVYISGVSGTVPEVKLAQANSASTMPAFGLALANANDQAEVQIITFGNLTDYNTTTYSLSANDTVFVSATTAGALTNSAPTGETNLIQNIGRVVRADASAGIIKVGGAGRSNATPNLDQDKIFIGNASNQSVSTALSSIGLSKFNNDSNFLTNINNQSLNDLSDVSYTAGAGIDNYVLTYDHSSTSWGAEVVPSAPVTSVNTLTGAVVVSGNDILADHTATYYTSTNNNIDGHLSGIDTKFGTLGTASTSATTDFLSATGADSLGGNLDVNGNDIVSSSNGDIELAPNGTGSTIIKGNATGGSGHLVLNCEQNTHGITLKGPAHSASATYELVFPTGVGTDGQVLKTDGGDSGTPNSVQLAWVDQASGGGYTYSAITADPSNAQANYHYSCTGTFTITLATSGMNAGEEIRIKNMGTGTITIDPQTSTIDGSTNDYTLDIQYSAITLVSTGTNWEIV